MQAKIGVQGMMLKDKFKEMGLYDGLKKMKDIGFSYIELSQIPMTPENVAEIKRACEDFDIKIAAMSAALEDMGMGGENLTDDFEKIVDDCKTLNCNYLRVGMLPFQLMGNMEKILEFSKKMDKMAERLAEHGIHLYYHNHHVEFEKIDGEFMLYIIRDTAQKIGFELDVHWVHRGGVHPPKVIRDFAGKVGLIHLKDYRIAKFDPAILNYMKEGDFKTFMDKFANRVEFAEVGEGSLDFKEIIEAGIEAGAEYFLIEQDDTYGRDPFESLEISRDNLVKLGYADMF